jgi:hypothetical protein
VCLSIPLLACPPALQDDYKKKPAPCFSWVYDIVRASIVCPNEEIMVEVSPRLTTVDLMDPLGRMDDPVLCKASEGSGGYTGTQSAPALGVTWCRIDSMGGTPLEGFGPSRVVRRLMRGDVGVTTGVCVAWQLIKRLKSNVRVRVLRLKVIVQRDHDHGSQAWRPR